MYKIQSPNSKQFKYLLRVMKNREDAFLLEGRRSIEQAMDNNLEIIEIYLREGVPNCFSQGVILTKELFQRLSSVETSQGYIALVKKKVPIPVKGDRVLLLDGVQDPGNLGTLLRSALAFDFTDVLLMKGCVDVYNPKVLRASLSAALKLNIHTEIEKEFLQGLKEKYEITGTFLENATSFREESYSSPVIVVLGSESFGISKEVEALVDKRIYIPMKETMESLNVAVAGSIIMEDIFHKSP